MTQQDIKETLVKRLSEQPDLEVALWKDTDLSCVFYKGKELAHFHGDDVLDIRLSPKIIREEGLPRAVSADIHPNRSQNSRWIGVQFGNTDDIERVLKLVERACAETM